MTSGEQEEFSWKSVSDPIVTPALMKVRGRCQEFKRSGAEAAVLRGRPHCRPSSIPASSVVMAHIRFAAQRQPAEDELRAGLDHWRLDSTMNGLCMLTEFAWQLNYGASSD